VSPGEVIRKPWKIRQLERITSYQKSTLTCWFNVTIRSDLIRLMSFKSLKRIHLCLIAISQNIQSSFSRSFLIITWHLLRTAKTRKFQEFSSPNKKIKSFQQSKILTISLTRIMAKDKTRTLLILHSLTSKTWAVQCKRFTYLVPWAVSLV